MSTFEPQQPQVPEVVNADRMVEGELSPKTVLAFLYPFIATLVGVLATWVITGEFDTAEIRTGIAGLLASGLAALGSWTGRPGPVLTAGSKWGKRADKASWGKVK